MSELKTVEFMFRCPKGHGSTFTYYPAKLRVQLDDGTFEHYCPMCGESYAPTDEEKRNLWKLLDEAEGNN